MGKLQSSIAMFEVPKYYTNTIDELMVGETIEIVDIHHYECGATFMYVTRQGKSKWNVGTVLRYYENEEPLLEKVLNDRIKYEEPNLTWQKKDFYELCYLIKKDTSIKELFEFIKKIREEVVQAYEALSNNKLYPKVKESVLKTLPIYEKAKNLIIKEFEANAALVKREKYKIVNVEGRVKDIASITEKVYRMQIPQYEVFSTFDDIAGVRVICQYIAGVYDLLNYISVNSAIKVIEVDDKIKNPSSDGYRGIHIIAAVDVYDDNDYYNDIRVEIQLRTALQNAWALNTERFTYKRDSIEGFEDKYTDIIGEMQKLSEVFFKADTEAELLADKIDKLIY